jgi:probable phosphoglycerate mutase
MTGQADFPLLPEGEEQARVLRDELACIVFSAAWCSPLQRAKATARIILEGNSANTADIVEVPALKELSLGLWDGKDSRWCRANFPQEWQERGRDFAGTAPPGGESVSELAERVLPAFGMLCRVAARHSAALLVAHQAVNRVIISRLAAMPLAMLRDIPQPPAAVTRIMLSSGGARAVLVRDG